MASLDPLSRELDDLRASSTRAAIEAEDALHDLTAQLAQRDTELEHERGLVTVAEASRAAEHARYEQLEAELAHERAAKTGDAALHVALRAAQAQTEQEKRELLVVTERSEAEKEALQDSLSALRSLYSSLQTSHSTLEAAHQDTVTSSRTAVLRVQTLTSTIASLETDKTFLTQELERSRSGATAYRREKHAEVIELQAKLETAELAATGASSGLEKLKKVHESLVGRHEEVMGSLSSTKEELALSTSQFVTEMSALRRLVDMMETREGERKKRMEEVEAGLEQERSSKVARENELIEELEREREHADALEARCSEMRQALERGGSGPNGFIEDDLSGTPSAGFALSPSAQIAVRLQKTGRSYAEVYTEYVRMQDDLASERAETKRLGECLSQILGDIEERAPLLKEQRVEYERLTAEATLLASQLAQALTDRDDISRESESYRLSVDRLERDNSIVGAQLRDLGRQVRTLMRSIAVTEYAGIEGRSLPPDADFDEEDEEIKKRAEMSNDTDAVVSAHLVTFHTINELQVQNQKLLRITREMGAQMERGEAEILGRRKGEENAAVEEAHELILRLKDEVESQRAKTEAFAKERDMFRRMLAQRGAGAEGVGMLGNGEGHGVDGDAPQLLAQVQANFDAYRAEIAMDSQRLREDVVQARSDANTARTDLAKLRAQSEFLGERFRLLNETYDLQSGEIAQMSKRTLQLQQAMAKQDASTHKMTEDLLELRSTSDRLRHENTNYRSEREVWKSVETRLIEENAALSKERAHLADLMRNLQTMQNELERAGNESRRRLDEQLVRLESQAVDLKDRLSHEMDSSRQLALRKELDGRTYQERIDKLTVEHAATRESLIVAKTSQEHLEHRVADLVLQVTSREEKLAVYEGRSIAADGTLDPTLSRDQQLEVEVVSLKNELRTLQTKLDQATANVEQYQSISLTQGESLSEIHATYDAYRVSTDGALAEKESEINGLRERLHSLTTEITTANTENSELHRRIEEERTAFEKERKGLEDDMVNLRLADQTAREAQLAAQDDLRRQAQIARDAHEKYERELVAHADDVKRLTEIKDELERIRATVGEAESSAEVAKFNLASSETSWTRQKSILEQEITDLKRRCVDLNSQNAVLHEHLETFGTQAAKIQTRGTDEADIAADSDMPSANTESSEQLREVIRYLRREKDIVDLQLEFSKQEAARLRQQSEFAMRNLDEARQALTEERQRSGDTAASSAQHAELLERIHTAKLLRESNSALRDENESNMRKAAALDARLRQALAELDPLKEQVQTLQAVVENKEHHLKLVEEDNERWKNRNQQILAKYERIDPEELQVLKDEVDKVKLLLGEAVSEKAAVAESLAEQTKLAESMRNNWTNAADRFKSIQTQARAMRTENVELAKELLEVKEKLETVGVQGAATSDVAMDTDLQSEKARLVALAATLEQDKVTLEERLRQETTSREEAIKTLEERSAALAALAAEKEAALAENANLETQVARYAKREKPIFEDNKRLSREAKEHSDAMDKLQKDFVEKNAEVIETAVAARIALAGPPVTLSDAAIEETVRERVAVAEAALASTRDASIAKSVETATAQLRIDLAAAQEQLAAAATSLPSDSPDTAALTATFEATRQKMETDFEAIKVTLAAQAKARELEITTRLTAEIKQATAKLSTAAASSTPAEIEALVKARLDALEPARLAAQNVALDAAVAKALETRRVEHQAELANAKVKAEKEAGMKNTLLIAQLNKHKQAAAKAAAAAAPALPPLVSTAGAAERSPTTAARGGGAGRGGARGRGAPAGLAARVGGPAVAAIRGSGAPTLALRGAAAGRGGGGVLNQILASNAAANASIPVPASPKRARDDDSSATSPAEAAKRAKQGGAPPAP